jgi:hypothetical protein
MSEIRAKALEIHELLSKYDHLKIRELLIRAAERVMKETNCFRFENLLTVSRGHLSGTVTDTEMGERYSQCYNVYVNGMNDFSCCQCDPHAKFPNIHYACFCAAWTTLMSPKFFDKLANFSKFAFPVALFFEHYKAVLDDSE